MSPWAPLLAVLIALFTPVPAAVAQPFQVDVLPMPFNGYLSHDSRHSMTIGVSRDGNIVSGNGYEFDSDPGGYPDTFRYSGSVGYQYNRTTGAFSYFPTVPGGGSPTYFQTVSPAGDAGIVTSGFINDYFWVGGQGYTRPYTGPGELYPTIANGARTVIGETPISPYGSFVYRDGAMASPAPPAGFAEYYTTAVSADGNSFVTDEGLYYHFGSGWVDLNQIAPAGWSNFNLTAVSGNGTTIVGAVTTSAGRVDFRWSSMNGFDVLETSSPLVLAFETGTSDLSILIRGGALYSDATGLIDFVSMVNASGSMPAGFTMVSLSGIADDGRTFSGIASDTANRQYSVVVTSIPSPPTVVGMIVGLMAVRRRRSS